MPTPANANSPSQGDKPASAAATPTEPRNPDREPLVAPEDATVADWTEADASRPDLPEETADGLDDTDEEIRHQAEDMPLDTPGRMR